MSLPALGASITRALCGVRAQGARVTLYSANAVATRAALPAALLAQHRGPRAWFGKKAAKPRRRPPKTEWDYDSKPVPDWKSLPEETLLLREPVPDVVQTALSEGARQNKWAVIVAKGDTLRVQAGDVVYMHRIQADINDVLTFPDVQVVGCDSYTVTGSPVIQSASVYGVVEEQKRLAKITREKFKKRKNYHKVWGHRQPVTVVRIIGVDFEYDHASHPDPPRPLTPKPEVTDYSPLPFEEQWAAYSTKRRAWDYNLPGQNPNQYPSYLENARNEYVTLADKLPYIREKFGV